MTKEIQLSQGQVALVDDDDYECLSQWKWYAHCRRGIWYAVRNGSRTGNGGRQGLIQMHRVIMNAPKGLMVDHKNHNGLDNTRKNLRLCDNMRNHQNTVIRANNTSGYKGVWWSGYKWIAEIRVEKKKIHLGAFGNKITAAKAYNRAAVEYFGEFAWLNPL